MKSGKNWDNRGLESWSETYLVLKPWLSVIHQPGQRAHRMWCSLTLHTDDTPVTPRAAWLHTDCFGPLPLWKRQRLLFTEAARMSEFAINFLSILSSWHPITSYNIASDWGIHSTVKEGRWWQISLQFDPVLQNRSSIFNHFTPGGELKSS